MRARRRQEPKCHRRSTGQGAKLPLYCLSHCGTVIEWRPMRGAAAVNQNSILGTCVKAMGRALDAAGCNGPALLAQAGFESKDLEGPDARAPLRKTGRLWKFALAATGDPAFGVKLARHYTYTTFHSLGYGMSASSTLKEAFERAQRYFRVVSDAVEFRFLRHADEYHCILEPTT